MKLRLSLRGRPLTIRSANLGPSNGEIKLPIQRVFELPRRDEFLRKRSISRFRCGLLWRLAYTNSG
jgi:hypothetical protein